MEKYNATSKKGVNMGRFAMDDMIDDIDVVYCKDCVCRFNTDKESGKCCPTELWCGLPSPDNGHCYFGVRREEHESN